MLVLWCVSLRADINNDKDDSKQLVKETYMKDMEPFIASNRKAMHTFLHSMGVSLFVVSFSVALSLSFSISFDVRIFLQTIELCFPYCFFFFPSPS